MPKRSSDPPKKKQPIAAKPDAVAAVTGSEWMTTRELMDYLQISRTKIWQFVRDETNPLPAFKLGGDYRFRRTEVDAWMESMRIQSEGGK